MAKKKKRKKEIVSGKRKKRVLGILGIVSLALVVLLAYLGRMSSPYIIRDNRVTMDTTEFRFSPANLQATPGEVTFSVVNTGRIAHALAIQGLGVRADTRLIQPGQRGVLIVKFEQIGKYKLVCPVRGHAARGMVGNLRVVTKQKEDRTTSG
jgi:plastocyanin